MLRIPLSEVRKHMKKRNRSEVINTEVILLQALILNGITHLLGMDHLKEGRELRDMDRKTSGGIQKRF
jgi:ssRNA-specific RNase YbeY (16S rRNA maturation enzyme)